MAHDTHQPPIAVGELFPDLAPMRKEALRLCPFTGDPTDSESSMGGPLRWPADEPWPTCDEEHFNSDGDSPEEDTVHEAVVAPVPVIQLYAKDAPGVPFPEGRDLLQVLWCPFNHGELYDRYPSPRIYWRSAAEIDQVAPTPAPPEDAPEGNVPEPCVVYPEQVSEYPSMDDIPQDVRARIEDRLHRLPEETGWSYFYHLSTAPGTKLGGWPRWNLGFVWPECKDCGQPMPHLLTVDSTEYDGESKRAWGGGDDRPTGLDLGDSGKIYLFECQSCPDRPVEHRFDFG